MGEQSFINLIDDPNELNRILDKYVFKINPNIKNFEEFDDAFREAFNSEKGKNTGLTTDKILKFFETQEVKNRIRENISPDEYDKLYGDGIIVKRQAISKTKIVTIITPKIKMKSYIRKGKIIKQYNRGKPRNFSPVETKFIQVRKQKKMTPKQIITSYNKHFSNNPRTSSSIRTKLFRI